MQDATLEVLPPEEKQLQPLVLTLDANLEPDTQQSLMTAFQGFYQSADEWRAKALSIQITRPDQLREMKLARETRLALREIRIKADKRRKELKEDGLRRGKAIDGAYNMLAYVVEPLEEHLLKQEQFIANMEQERKAKLKAEREEALRPFADVSLYQLADMDEPTFNQLLETNRLAYAARQEAARKAEAERVERERIESEERAKREAAEADERERLRQANIELARKNAEIEAQAKAEREKLEAAARAVDERQRQEREAAEAHARKEREAREAAEAALKAKEAEEQKKRDDALAAARAAAAAPDREKLTKLAADLRALEIPLLTTAAGREIQDLIQTQVNKFAVWIENQTTKLQ